VNVNAADPTGATPLHLAVIYGFSNNDHLQHAPDVIRMLMKAGADPFKKIEIPDEFGDTFAHTVIELFDIPKIRRRIPGAVRDMVTASSRVAARKHLNAALPNDVVQTILHRAGVTSVSEHNPSMPEQIRLDRLALKNTQAKRKRAGAKVTGVKRPRVVTRSQTRGGSR
jgi:ankyrin repeat protein